MIAGIGVDIVEVARFARWDKYRDKQLLRLFTQKEIVYCRSTAGKAAERFAVRFAAREAFYKAFSSAYPDNKVPFLTLCKALEVQNTALCAPSLQVAWSQLGCSPLHVQITLSHSAAQAIAMVVLENPVAMQ